MKAIQLNETRRWLTVLFCYRSPAVVQATKRVFFRPLSQTCRERIERIIGILTFMAQILYVLFPSVVSCLNRLAVEFKVQENLFCRYICPFAAATDDHFAIVIFALVNIWDGGASRLNRPGFIFPADRRRASWGGTAADKYAAVAGCTAATFHPFTWLHFLVV